MSSAFEQVLRQAKSQPGTPVILRPGELEGLYRRRVPGDGQCFWHALAAAEHEAAEHETQLASRGWLEHRARQWRQAVADELWDEKAHRLREPYGPFWAPGEEGGGAAHTAAAYVRAVRSGGVFGGALEIAAATAVAPVTVGVVDIDCAGRSTLVTFGQRGGRLLLLTRSRNHYDAVRVAKKKRAG